MKATNKTGMIFVFSGIVLILLALSLFLYNQYEDAKAGKEAMTQLSLVQDVIRERKKMMLSQPDGRNKSVSIEQELSIAKIDGYHYLGYLSIPTLSLALPVMSEWDDERLKIAPCRQFGSPREDNMVIAAHNYNTHFGYLSKLKADDPVFFTDMDGITYEYEVALVGTVTPSDVDSVQNSDHDLVLYTCTYSGQTRVAVFCDRLEK